MKCYHKLKLTSHGMLFVVSGPIKKLFSIDIDVSIFTPNCLSGGYIGKFTPHFFDSYSANTQNIYVTTLKINVIM